MRPSIATWMLQLPKGPTLLYQLGFSYKIRGVSFVYTVDALFYPCHPQLGHLITRVPENSSTELKGF